MSLLNFLLVSWNDLDAEYSWDFVRSSDLSPKAQESLLRKLEGISRQGHLADWGYAVPFHPGNITSGPDAEHPDVVPSQSTSSSLTSLSSLEAHTLPTADSGENLIPVQHLNSSGSEPDYVSIPDLKSTDDITLSMGGNPLMNPCRPSIDTNSLYRTVSLLQQNFRALVIQSYVQGTWSWMATELVMIGPGRPVTHMPYHDLESIFYVLLGISMLYDEPYKLKPEEDLSECFDIYFNTDCPSLRKTFTIQSELGWLSSICERLSDYFKPLRPLFDTFREKIVLPMTYVDGSFRQRTATPITHVEMVKCLINALYNLPDDAWVTMQDASERDNLLSNKLPITSCVYNSDSGSLSENSSETETPPLTPIEPVPHISRFGPIRPISGPGFTGTSSNSTRRSCPGLDEDYVDPSESRAKRPRFNVDTTSANHTNPRRSISTRQFVVTAPGSLSLPRCSF